jgi:hypothetical protein
MLGAMPLPIRILSLRRGDRGRLEELTRSRTAAHRVVERAHIVLASADGEPGSAICARFGVSRPTVTCWLDRYDAEGLAGVVADRPRSGAYSGAIRPPIPGESGHPFRCKAATHSGRMRPLLPEESGPGSAVSA